MIRIRKNKSRNKIKSIYVYPTTSGFFKEGSNTYIQSLRRYLSQNFILANYITKIGLLDILFKLHKTDILYFNWIEDIPDKKYGFIQLKSLKSMLLLAKLFNVKVVWFIHNNISHSNKNLLQKKKVIKIMTQCSDLILSHSNEIKIDIPHEKFHVFHHPLDFYEPAEMEQNEIDLLIWGTVSDYKGIKEFVEYATENSYLKTLRIRIAGKFKSNELFEEIKSRKTDNITIVNNLLSEDELMKLFSASNYILFTYKSESILSSAALCKSLSHGKQIIAPRIGAFKELGNEGLLHTYESFYNLENLIRDLNSGNRKKVELSLIEKYYQVTNWNSFTHFLNIKINDLYSRVA
jgi:beta-1,4-mannosyltransferase